MPTPSSTVQTSSAHADINITRRANLMQLLRDFTETDLAAGHQVKGLELRFAASLGISGSLLSQLKKSRNISDKMAQQIENRSSKSPSWLSLRLNAEQPPSAAQQAFIEMATAAWVTSDSKGRRRLMQLAQVGFGLGLAKPN